MCFRNVKATQTESNQVWMWNWNNISNSHQSVQHFNNSIILQRGKEEGKQAAGRLAAQTAEARWWRDDDVGCGFWPPHVKVTPSVRQFGPNWVINNTMIPLEWPSQIPHLKPKKNLSELQGSWKESGIFSVFLNEVKVQSLILKWNHKTLETTLKQSENVKYTKLFTMDVNVPRENVP